MAARQYGVVSGRQLLGIGYSPRAIARAVENGRLHRLHSAVFAVGHRGLTKHGRALAAVLARGEGALLSYESAAWLWGLTPVLARDVEVSVRWRGHSRPGLRLHHCPALRDEDAAAYEGIQVTAVPRTLLDFASTARGLRLAKAVERAHLMDLLDLGQIDRLLEEVRGHRGRGLLKRALTIYRDPAFSRSGGELRFLQLLREEGLPRPLVNTWAEGFELDFYWEDQRFAVELDSWDAHRSRVSFEKDPVRQEDLKLAGIEMIRVTGRRLAQQPDEVARRLRIHLRRRDAELSARHHPAFAVPAG